MRSVLRRSFAAFEFGKCSETGRSTNSRALSSCTGEQLLDTLHNNEQSGIPDGAATVGPTAFDLGVMHKLLQAIGDPQVGLPVVQIVGTKGKGSVSAMLSAMLRHAGYKVGSYTSPHLLSLRERIAVNGTPISQSGFDSLVKTSLHQATAALGGQLFSHFEMMTAMAVQHFASDKVDIAVMEAGLGGSHDATNIFDPKQVLATVVTTVDLDHLGALGGSLESIARAKAGIIKPGCPVVIGHQIHLAAKRIISQRASDLECRLYDKQACLWPGPVTVDNHGACQTCKVFILNGEMADPAEVVMRLVGKHQHENAITAISAALALRRRGFDRLNVQTMLEGLQEANLPGRFQVGRVNDPHNDGSDSSHDAHHGSKPPWLVLDAAHTAGSAAALSKTLREAFPAEQHRLAYVLAMANDKDLSGICTALRSAKPAAAAFTTVPIANSTSRCAPPGTLIAHWQNAGFAELRPTRIRETIQASLAAAVMKAQAEVGATSDGIVCVTGSLHAVAAALQQNLFRQP